MLSAAVRAFLEERQHAVMATINRLDDHEDRDFAAFIGAEAIATHANRRNNLPLEVFWSELLDVCRRPGDYALDHGGGVRLG